jgi:hypothetical protein
MDNESMTEEDRKWYNYVEYMNSLNPGDLVLTHSKELWQYVGFVNGQYIFCQFPKDNLCWAELGELEDVIDISHPRKNKVYINANGRPVELNIQVLYMMCNLLGLENPEYTPFSNEGILEWGTHYPIGTIGNEKRGTFSIYSDGKLSDIVIVRIKKLLEAYQPYLKQ